MKMLIAIALATVLTAGSAMAQSVPAAPATTDPGVPLADVPLLGVAKVAPTCGGLTLSAPAYCVTAPLSEMSTVSDLYISHYEGQGWLAADGADNRIVMIRRLAGGGCEGLQIIAFYDTVLAPGPATPGYLGFATIPGNVCANSMTEAPAQ